MPLSIDNSAPSTAPATAGPAVIAIDEVKPVVREQGLAAQLAALLRYLTRTEVHTYAFSVAANAILSLFPFIVLLLTVSHWVFHSASGEAVVASMMKRFLPTGQDFVLRNMQLLAHPRKGTQIFSLIMLLITSTGVFMPLEVALNRVWGVRENRSYLHNQAVSLGLAFGAGALAMASVAITASQKSVLGLFFFGHMENAAYVLLSHGFLTIFAVLTSVLMFFLVYWVLPNRSIPVSAVLPTAVVVGLLWEAAKLLYIRALPWLDFQAVYGPFYISVGLMMWAFLTGLLLLAGAHFSATRFALRATRYAEREAEGHAA